MIEDGYAPQEDVPAVEQTYSDEELKQAEGELKLMTPEGYLALLKYVKYIEEQTKFPEAQAVAYTKLYDAGGMESLVITVRSADSVDAIDQLMKARDYAAQRYSMSISARAFTKPLEANKSVNLPPTDDTEDAVEEEDNPFSTPKATSPAVVGDPVTETASGSIYVNRMVITPQADGKSKVEFYAPGHKFADLRVVQTPDWLAKFMKPTGNWMPKHFVKAYDTQVSLEVSWQNSTKLNSYNKPYKNVVGIKTAPDKL